ncbi:hypothetical protein BJ742DRAFT_72856 [Cladochytrium replicatum]|nr:hypothetical protein BJ742DRAFT_72856 [Cladochytrium replicatum]
MKVFYHNLVKDKTTSTSTDQIEHLRELLAETGIIVDYQPEPTLREDGRHEYEVVITGQIDPALLDNGPVHTVIVPWAGIPPNVHETLSKRPGIRLLRSNHNTLMTAEMAITLMLACARNLVFWHNDMVRNGGWGLRYAENSQKPTDWGSLYGKHALILGFGHIGRQIGKVCHALGMHVTAVVRSPETATTSPKYPPLTYPVSLHPLSDLPTLLPKTSVLHIALPGTPSTTHLLNLPTLSLLPPHRAILINVGRGSIVDPSALHALLASKHIAAAGIDVWWSYPGQVASTYPNTATSGAKILPWSESCVGFEKLDNVVLSPHRGGGAGGETEVLRMHAVAEMLMALKRVGDGEVRGEEGERVVLGPYLADPAEGY